MEETINSQCFHGEMCEVVFVWRHECGWPIEFVSDNVSFFGYESDDFLNGALSYEDIIHPLDVANVRKGLWKFADCTDDNLIQEYRILKPDGNPRWVRENTEIMYDEDGFMQYLKANIVDINDEKKRDDFMIIQDELGSDLSWPENLDESITILIELTTQLKAIDFCALHVVDEVTGGLVLVGHKGLSSDFVNRVSYFGTDSIQVTLAKEEFPIYMHYSESYPYITGSCMRTEGLQGTAIIPINHEHHFVGLLIVSSSSEFIIPEDIRDSLEVIRSLAGLMISDNEIGYEQWYALQHSMNVEVTENEYTSIF